MKKILWVIPVLALLVGCTADGTLKVENDSAANLSTSIGDISAYNYLTQTYELSTSIFGDETKDVTVSYDGLYVFDGSRKMTVNPDETTTMRVDADAGGLIVQNDSYSYYIYEVYISPSSDDYWGSDDLSGSIYPGDYALWQCSPGYWDVKVVDNWGDEYTALGFYISVNSTYTLYYDPYRSDQFSKVDIKAESCLNFEAPQQPQICIEKF